MAISEWSYVQNKPSNDTFGLLEIAQVSHRALHTEYQTEVERQKLLKDAFALTVTTTSGQLLWLLKVAFTEFSTPTWGRSSGCSQATPGVLCTPWALQYWSKCSKGPRKPLRDWSIYSRRSGWDCYSTRSKSSGGFIHAHKHLAGGVNSTEPPKQCPARTWKNGHKITKYREFQLNVTLLLRKAAEPPFLRTFKPQLETALSKWLQVTWL